MQRMHVLPSLPLVSAVVAAPPRTNTGDSDVQDAGAGILGQAINPTTGLPDYLVQLNLDPEDVNPLRPAHRSTRSSP